MKFARLALLLGGGAAFAWLVADMDPAAVWDALAHVGWSGVAVIFAVYLAAFVVDTLSWQLTLPSVRTTVSWLFRLWKVRMVGSAVNNATPFASLGGEPLKALLLRRHYDISWPEGAASLVLAQTVNNIGLVFFLLAGIAAMFATDALPPLHRLSASVGLGLFATSIAGFFLVQRYRISSQLAGRLHRSRWARIPLAARIAAAGKKARRFEDRLIVFYTGKCGRFATAVALAFVTWTLGAVEIWLAMRFLGQPVTFTDAWVIESVTVLLRSTLFFVPANIGIQDGTLVVLVSLMTGSAPAGLALALLRRFRELAWIGFGLAIGSSYSVGIRTAAVAVEPRGEPD